MDVRVARNGSEIGTFQASEIATLLTEGTLQPGDFFWLEGNREWLPILSFTTTYAPQSPPEPGDPQEGAVGVKSQQRGELPRRTGSGHALGALMRAAGHLFRAGFMLLFNLGRLLFSWISIPLIGVARFLTRAANSTEKITASMAAKLEKDVSNLEREIDASEDTD